MADERIFKCEGHEELMVVATATKVELKGLNSRVAELLEAMGSQDQRVRSLEVYGAKVSQDNAKGLESLTKRVEIIESYISAQKGATKEAAKIGALVGAGIGGIISLIGVLFAVHLI